MPFSTKKGAGIIKQVLESAIANAEHNEGADIDELKVAAIQVNEGPTMKRIHAACQGSREPHHETHQSHHVDRG